MKVLIKPFSFFSRVYNKSKIMFYAPSDTQKLLDVLQLLGYCVADSIHVPGGIDLQQKRPCVRVRVPVRVCEVII